MSRILFFCVVLNLLACVCQAQRDSVILLNDPIPTASSSFLRHKWLSAEAPKTGVLSMRNYAPPINTLYFRNLRLRTDWTEEPIFLTDYYPHASPEEYNAMLKSGLGFTYDPLNPYGVSSASDGLIDGAINSLLWLMFPCK